MAIMSKEDYSLADRLAIPPSVFKRLSKKELYILDKNAPDQIEKYWDLEAFPKYLIKKYNLTRESAIIRSSNATQKDLELFLAWKLALFMSRVSADDTHLALALPKHDRGVECYIRCLDIDKEILAAIAIQICDIVIDPGSLGCKGHAETVFDLAAKAKAKPVDCSDAILLMHLKGYGSNGVDITIDRFLLRDMFDAVKWSYRKIIFVSSSKEHVDTYITLYSDRDSEHFIGSYQKYRKIKMLVGRTRLDEVEYSKKANLGPVKGLSHPFWI